MKNLIIAALIFSCTLAHAQITQTFVHKAGGSIDTYQLSDLDSIVYDSLNINMIIYKSSGNTVSYTINSIDSLTFDTLAIAMCVGTFTDSRDNEVYTVVQIGNQCWMAENLRFNASGSWLNNANPSSNYGRLYNWSTLMVGSSTSSSVPSGVQGICPNGWHIPSDAEFTTMINTIGGVLGTAMKSSTGWNNNGNGTNTSGFNAFPSGFIFQGGFYDLGGSTIFWSSTEDSSTSAWCYYLGSSSSGIQRNDNPKTYGYSCRCVRD